MGSHSAFNMRYPLSYNQFSGEEYSSDYPNLSVKNRQLLAEYDNSIFYNDKVVNELFNIFQNKEAIVFYFSDHGIDAFYSSDDYIGHATQNNESSVRYAKEIPFVIYTTPLYKEKFVDEYQRMSQSLSKNYSTDSLIYTLMDVAGVEKVDGVVIAIREYYSVHDQLKKAISALKFADAKILGFILNDSKGNGRTYKYRYRYSYRYNYRKGYSGYDYYDNYGDYE